jgi:hypothetical protein
MPNVITHYNVPSTKYKYTFPQPGPAQTEYFKLTINPTAVAPKTGRASLRLEVKTPGDPFGVPVLSGISNVVVSIAIPNTVLSSPNTPAGATAPLLDPANRSVLWTHLSIASGVNVDYQVDFAWLAAGAQKIEVTLRADELDRPVRMLVRALLP